MNHAHNTQAATARRSAIEIAGLLLGLLGTGLLLNQHLLRLFAETDLWSGLRSPALKAWEWNQFQSVWPLDLLHVVAASLALLLGPGAVARTLSGERRSGAFMATRRATHLDTFSGACLVAAGTAAALSLKGGDHAPGGTALAFYGAGLGLLWSLFVGMAWWGGRRSPMVRRDWTIYCYATALLPLSTLPAVPLWASLLQVGLDTALTTAVVMAFPFHLLAAHLVIFEVLERRRPTTRAGLGQVTEP